MPAPAPAHTPTYLYPAFPHRHTPHTLPAERPANPTRLLHHCQAPGFCPTVHRGHTTPVPWCYRWTVTPPHCLDVQHYVPALRPHHCTHCTHTTPHTLRLLTPDTTRATHAPTPTLPAPPPTATCGRTVGVCHAAWLRVSRCAGMTATTSATLYRPFCGRGGRCHLGSRALAFRLCRCLPLPYARTFRRNTLEPQRLCLPRHSLFPIAFFYPPSVPPRLFNPTLPFLPGCLTPLLHCTPIRTRTYTERTFAAPLRALLLVQCRYCLHACAAHTTALRSDAFASIARRAHYIYAHTTAHTALPAA